MATYSDLELNKSYLIIESEGDEIQMITPLMETDSCVLIELSDYEDDYVWRKKYDDFFELVDELSDEQVEEYETIVSEFFDDVDEEDEE